MCVFYSLSLVMPATWTNTHTALIYSTILFKFRFCSPYYVYVNLKVPFIPLHHYFMCIYSVKMMDTDGNAVPII